MKRLMGVLAMLLLGGCTGKIVMVDFNINSDNGSTSRLELHANGSTLTTETTQDAKSDLAGAMEGAQAAIGNILKSTAESKPDFSKKDSENQTTTNNTTPAEPKPEVKPTEPPNEDVDDGIQGDTGVEEVSEDIEYKNKATFSSYGVRNGRQAWRISGKGPSFGEPIKFVFSSGKTFTVKDTDKNCRDDENTCARSSSADMYGFVFKPGIGPNGDGDSDTGTSHGGIYLHAPWKDTSGSVTLYYNKP